MLRHLTAALLLSLSPLACAADTPPPAATTSPLQLSPVAQQLAACPETPEGIRQRLSIILQQLTRQSVFYHTDTLPAPQLELIPISVSPGTPQHLGGTRWAASQSKVYFRMDFFTSALPVATDDASRLLREITLVDTLVHELAHCFFFARYPKLGLQSSGTALSICEGYAIHVARTFMQQHYFPHAPQPIEYYERIFLSPRYTRLYRDFRTRFLSPAGSIPWQVIDSHERRIAPPGYTLQNRTQLHPASISSQKN